MVKIDDPRYDRSSIALRTVRADRAAKYIKKTIEKNTLKSKYFNKFNEKRLGLQKYDLEFYNDFMQCPDEIKKELIFLWEEVHDLTERLNENDKVEINVNEKPKPPEDEESSKKRMYIFGP